MTDNAHLSTMNNHATHGGPLRDIRSHCAQPSVHRMASLLHFLTHSTSINYRWITDLRQISMWSSALESGTRLSKLATIGDARPPLYSEKATAEVSAAEHVGKWVLHSAPAVT